MQLEEHLARDDRIVLPLGSTEQHAYLSLGTDSLHAQGFRRVLLVNGHGGNVPGAALAAEWMAENPGAQALFFSWWNAPRTWAAVQSIDPDTGHASWLESYPWTRVEGVEAPREGKPKVDLARLRIEDPAGVRRLLG